MHIPSIPIATQMSHVGNHSWSVARLITLAKELPVMVIPIEHLYVFYKYKELTLRELVMHIKAVQDADLTYPVILDEDGVMMDGRHRLMKAILEGHEMIKAVRFAENPHPCEIHD